MSETTKNKARINIYTMLVVYALVPLLTTVTVISALVSVISRIDTKKMIEQSVVSVTSNIGYSIDYFDKMCNNSVKTFATAPIVKEYLLNPDNAELAEKAEQYTVDYFGALEGWEGIYIADWNSKVLTHPATPVIGKVMREGERLEQLRNDMLGADGVLDYGIITSPASGQLIISMYYAVFDDNKNPIGYVGAGAFLQPICDSISDVSKLGLPSAYLYIVDDDGTMIYHPNEEEIGQPVENAAVPTLLGRMTNGETIEPGVASYEYKGNIKHDFYYAGYANNYLALISVDNADITHNVNRLTILIIAISVCSVVIFTLLALLIGRLIATPLKSLATCALEMADGKMNVEIEAKSHIVETVSLINAFHTLTANIHKAIGEVRNSVYKLDESVDNVADKTSINADNISQINQVIEEVAETAQQVAESAQSISDKAQRLGDNIDTMSDSIKSLKHTSDSISEANAQANDVMAKTMQSSKQTADAVNAIVDKINETHTAINKVNTCVEVIADISFQTNLLSLNASIEAARAGELGKGFSVVASEIRELSEASRTSTEEIKNIVDSIIELSKQNAESANAIIGIINSELQTIGETQDKYMILSELVETSLSDVAIISDIKENLVCVKDELVNSTVSLGAVSDELGASAEEVAANCNTVSVACDDTQNEANSMRDANQTLSESIKFFK